MSNNVMRLLVTGGRDFTDRDAVFAALDAANHKRAVKMLIHGAARGADTLAGEWARERGIECDVYPVSSLEWNALGKRAGHVRNQRMLDRGRPDGLIQFPGGAGTADMAMRARLAGIPVWQPHPGKGANNG